ncbi:unnamed protein product [Amoebophrya sp. A25]|nr:unnamed protein product [Amoebophrya sp. A25]|eukprot:GSA25T00004452001.1
MLSQINSRKLKIVLVTLTTTKKRVIIDSLRMLRFALLLYQCFFSTISMGANSHNRRIRSGLMSIYWSRKLLLYLFSAYMKIMTIFNMPDYTG